VEKVPTGIPKLDEILGGGFPRGGVILVAGNPGAGKTILAAKFIYEGAKRWKEPGVYLSFAESRKDFYRYMRELNMNFEELEKRNLFRFIDLPTVIDEEALTQIIKILLDKVVELRAKRVVIDSMTAMAQVLGKTKTRSLIHSSIFRGLKPFGVTTLLIADMPYGATTVGFGVEEFVVDGVLILKMEREKGLTRRLIEIRKMRGSPTSLIEMPFVITPEKGIEPLIVERPERIISFGEELVKTGIHNLDKLLGGGIPKGAQVLIAGPSGSGKSLLSLLIALHNASRGTKTLYISFEEPPAQMRMKANALGYDISKLPISFVSLNVTTYTYDLLMYQIIRSIEEYKPQIIIFDGVTQITKIGGVREFWFSSVNLFTMLKRLGITGIFTYAANYPEEHVELDTIADVIIVLRYERAKEELQRRLIVWKHRGAATPTKQALLIIGEGGKIEIRPEK